MCGGLYLFALMTCLKIMVARYSLLYSTLNVIGTNCCGFLLTPSGMI